MLYLIEILHQTTTVNGSVSMGSSLYLIEILHQTTTDVAIIQPRLALYLIEILHQTTTDHEQQQFMDSCILSKFYIKPQRVPYAFCCVARCILSKFYIKPQQNVKRKVAYIVVSYRNSTSNHNYRGFSIIFG